MNKITRQTITDIILCAIAVIVLALFFAPKAHAMKWRVSDCLLPDGQVIQVARQACSMYHQTYTIEQSTTAHMVTAERLVLNRPPDCNSLGGDSLSSCLLAQALHNEQVKDLYEVMGSPMKLQNAREDREQREKESKRQAWLGGAGLVLQYYGMTRQGRSRGGGTSYVAGDVFNVNGRAGGGGGEAAGGGSGVSITKSGDNAMAVNHRGNQQTGFLSSGLEQDNRRDNAAEFQPGAAEGSSATFSPNNPTDDNSNIGIGF